MIYWVLIQPVCSFFQLQIPINQLSSDWPFLANKRVELKVGGASVLTAMSCAPEMAILGIPDVFYILQSQEQKNHQKPVLISVFVLYSLLPL